MPVLNTLQKSMQERVDLFLTNATIFKPNKYFVGFYGPYLDEAIAKLTEEVNEMGRDTPKIQKNTAVHKKALDRWLKLYYDSEEKVLDLKWACSNVTVPHVEPGTKSDTTIDAIKTINYPLIQTYGKTKIVKLNIVEDRNMMMYQFFNALVNRFFSPQILKPKSSFQKLGMYIAVVQEDWVNSQGVNGTYNIVNEDRATIRDAILEDVTVQIFEFNSVVPKGISDFTFSSETPTKKMEFSIGFEVPNTFQDSFKTTFKGLRNNTADPVFLQPLDASTLTPDGKYNDSHFTVSKAELNTKVNGVFLDY